MKEILITFQVAKLAKEKGFKERCLNYYFEDGEFKEHKYIGTNGYYGEEFIFEYEELTENWNDNFLTKKNEDRCFGCKKSQGYFETFSAPTQSFLQRWLREKHNIHLGVWYNVLTRIYRIDYVIDAKKDIDIIEFSFDKYYAYSTYEECLEEALQIALNHIEL